MLMEKYEPNAPTELIKQNYQEKKVTKLNGYTHDMTAEIVNLRTKNEDQAKAKYKLECEIKELKAKILNADLDLRRCESRQNEYL